LLKNVIKRYNWEKVILVFKRSVTILDMDRYC
jgi:hypothetical protein